MISEDQIEEWVRDYLAIKEATLYALLLDSNEVGVEYKEELVRRIELSLDL